MKETPYGLHKKRWKNCTDCVLCKTRNRIVLGSGKIPCDVLFIGEAPGRSENILGKAFVGPAGALLDRMIEASGLCMLDVAKTNLVGCIPLENGAKLGEPDIQYIETCRPRLADFAFVCRPKVVVRVGKLVKQEVPGQATLGKCQWLKGKPLEFYDIIHPAAILRLDVSQKGLAIQRCVVTLHEITDVLHTRKNILP